MSMFDGYMRWNVLSGITLPCAPVSTLTRSVAGVSGLSFSVILRVAYTSSLSTALMLTVLEASGSKLTDGVDTTSLALISVGPDVSVAVYNVYILKSFILANFNQTWSCIVALHRRVYVTVVAYNIYYL